MVGSQYLVIYYSGLGMKGSGNWVMLRNEVISLDEVLRAIHMGQFSEQVQIWCDCSYAGKWAQQAQTLWNDNSTLISLKFQSILLECSCDGDDVIDWAAYRQFMKLNSENKKMEAMEYLEEH